MLGDHQHADFEDRKEAQAEISKIVEESFVAKETLNIDDYMKVIREVDSDMALSLIQLIREKLPCTINFKRFSSTF